MYAKRERRTRRERKGVGERHRSEFAYMRLTKCLRKIKRIAQMKLPFLRESARINIMGKHSWRREGGRGRERRVNRESGEGGEGE